MSYLTKNILMTKNANIYDLCDRQLLEENCQTEPGRNLQLIYKKLTGHFILKYLILKRCRHPDISLAEIPQYQNMT